MTKLQTVQHYRELAKYESSCIADIRNNASMSEKVKAMKIASHFWRMRKYIKLEKEAASQL